MLGEVMNFLLPSGLGQGRCFIRQSNQLPSALFVWVADTHVRSNPFGLGVSSNLGSPIHRRYLVLSGALFGLPPPLAWFFSGAWYFRRRFIRRCSSLVTPEGWRPSFQCQGQLYKDLWIPCKDWTLPSMNSSFK